MSTHLYYKKESTPGTWIAPDVAVGELEQFSVDPGESRITRRSVGVSRAPIGHDQGVHNPTGNIGQRIDTGNIRYLLDALGMTDVTTTTPGGTNPRDHVYHWAETTALPGYSVQAQQVREGTTESVNVRGLVLGDLTFNAAVDQYLMATGSWLGVEVVRDGADFEDGNTSSSNLTIAYSALARLFRFSDITLTTGGTVARDTGSSEALSFSGSSALTNVESVDIAVSTGKAHRNTLGGRTSAAIIDGDRTITVTLTLRNDAPNTAWLGSLLSGTSTGLLIKAAGPADAIESGYTNEVEFVVPSWHITSAPPGDVELARGAKTISVTGVAEYDATAATDFSVRVRNEETS